MDDFLKPVKTTKKVQSNISKFESLTLTEAQPRRNDPKPKRAIIEIDSTIEEEPLLRATSSSHFTESSSVKKSITVPLKKHKRHDSTAFLRHSYLADTPSKSLLDDAREILKSQPCHEDLKAVLEYLQYGIEGRHDFDVRITSPKSAQIINVLVTITIPDLWINLKQKEMSPDEIQMKQTMLACLSSAAGIGALVAQIRQFRAAQLKKATGSVMIDTIQVLAEILKGQKTVINFLHDSLPLYNKETQRQLFWQEVTALLAGGRVLGIVAQALDGCTSLDDDDNNTSVRWLTNGMMYSKWLAQNIVYAGIKLQQTEEESWKLLSQFFKRALSLGNRDFLVTEIYTTFLLGRKALWTPLHALLQGLSIHEQKIVFDAILHDLSKKYLKAALTVDFSDRSDTRRAISGAAALIAGVVKHNEALKEYLEEWLIVSNSSYAAIGLASRRAILATLAKSEDALERILEKSLSNFADKLQIQHNSMLQQEACAQTILLIIGCLQRMNVQILKKPTISTLVMRSVSNRLGASIPRARFLGMIIGVASSKALDAPDKILDFGIEEMENDEAQQWLGLSQIEDDIGTLSELQTVSSSTSSSTSVTRSLKPPRTNLTKHAPVHTSKVISIEEVSEDSSEDEDDLVPYSKPDSDPEDSDEDPTLINRSKPSAPVYIIDVIKYLGKTDQLDIIELALKTAPSLIRRKANFGTELSDNIHSLATSLINLQEGMSDPHLRQLRLDSLIACIVANPAEIAPSFAALFFEGDFSIFQRVTILTAISLGAREVAGFKENSNTGSQQDSFPSKRLPSHLELGSSKPSKLEPFRQNPINELTTTAAQSTIRPMALAAADKMTGPSILKIRTFSSRMAVQKRTEEKSQARTKIIPKNLHLLLTKSFYLPLCSRMALLLSYASGGKLNTTLLQPDLVRLLLQSLVLLLHTLGPSASLHLPTLTHETLTLLTSLHGIPSLATNPAILPALLHLLLALIDITVEAGVTAQERLITEHGSQVAELVNWANGLGERISVPDVGEAEGGGGMPWSVLAAGIQVRWFEMGQRFQGRMLGLVGGGLDGF